ncbi:ABC transporter permease [Paenibacillus contaminans]|uniref:ABC transporter permease n=1 Tax=Paenibacillus contaminans TaxID=450362 RepID=A0A329MLM3_9BACL|nr:ABC transporter permease [Paenibacillus contaminans]RAV18777.1 ABC transporter permease [Paenibacillus contaminans]
MSNQGELLASSSGTTGIPAAAGQARKRMVTFVKGALLPVTLLIVWQLLGDAGFISKLLFPTPARIGTAGYNLVVSGELWENLRISIVRAISGFVLGASLGLAFGIMVGLFRGSERTLDPSVQMIRMVPHLAVAPLFILWFGLGETSKILLIAKGAFFPLYINAFLGIRNADNKLFEVAKVLGFSRYKQLVRLVIPAALPNLLLGVRISLGIAWLGLVVAELMGSTSGIGYLMSDARQFSKTPVVFVCIIIFALVGKVADSAVRLLERKWLHGRDSFQGQ